MPEEEKPKRNGSVQRGIRKIGTGIAAWTPLGWIMGPKLFVGGIASASIGTVVRAVNIPFNNSTVEKIGRNLQDKGIKIAITGMVMGIPGLGGAVLCIEGVVNAYGKDPLPLGVEATARFISKLSGLPQYGDVGYDESAWLQPNPSTIRNPSKSEVADDKKPGIELKPIVKDSKKKTKETSKVVSNSEPKEKPSGPKLGDDSARKCAPVPEKNHEKLISIASKASYSEATVEYAEKTKELPKFIERSRENDGEFTKIFYVHPKYKDSPDKCPPDEMIEQKFDKLGNLVEVKPGDRASCVTAPIKAGDSFEMLHVSNGKSSNIVPAVKRAADLKSTLDVPPVVATTSASSVAVHPHGHTSTISRV